ncbi:MAG: CBS domain-containing protein [Bacteroidetes bacterium]|nr:CBS domain-containing protein [Bacteroidota bacterium]
MIATNNTYIIPPIHEKISANVCVEIMMDTECFELPVLKDNQLIGSVTLDDCISTKDKSIKDIISPGFLCIHHQMHLFDVLQIFKSSPKNVCAVLDQNGEWIGILTKNQIIDSLSQTLSIEQNGAILIIEMSSAQYSTNELSRIIEGEGSKVLGLWLHKDDDSARIKVTVKINTSNVERIINGFDRFGYDVIATFGDDDYKDNINRKFQSLMKYIDL